MKLECNKQYLPDNRREGIITNCIMMTPVAIGEDDYWVFKVQLSEDQAVIAFPKFSGYGIGFLKEDDWNTNLPYQCEIDKIFNHIKHNKQDESINDEDCIEAIRLLKEACTELCNSH